MWLRGMHKYFWLPYVEGQGHNRGQGQNEKKIEVWEIWWNVQKIENYNFKIFIQIPKNFEIFGMTVLEHQTTNNGFYNSMSC